MKRFILVAIAAVNICLSIASAAGNYAGGDGSMENPFQIQTAVQLDELGQHSEDWVEGTYFVLTDDIDLSGYDGEEGRPEFHTIGTGDGGRSFAGVFDGAGHTISNLTLDLTNGYVGLFGYLYGASGEVKNVGLIDINVSGEGAVGGLVGYNSGGRIIGCYANGSVSGQLEVIGGLVGYNRGEVINCSYTGNVSGSSNVGGLVGYNRGEVIDSYFTGNVSGSYNIGGLVGYSSGGRIVGCYSAGSVSWTEVPRSYIQGVGGLVGYNREGSIIESYSESSVSGGDYVGGLIGCNEIKGRYYDEQPDMVSRCYATGDVTGNDHVGGLMGYNAFYGYYIEEGLLGPVNMCYSMGSVTGDTYVGGLIGEGSGGIVANCFSTSDVSGDYSVGGLIGYDRYGMIIKSYAAGSVLGVGQSVGGLIGRVLKEDEPYSGCYWDSTVNAGLTDCGYDEEAQSYGIDLDGVEGASTTDMTVSETYTGWDFVYMWMMPGGGGYPEFVWNFSFGGGSGSVDDPYRIETAEQLYYLGVSPENWDKSFVVVDDIDMSGYDGLEGRLAFYPIGTGPDSSFTGVFDGGGRSISNLNVNFADSDYVGLFGYVEGVDAEIKNVGLIDVNVSGNYQTGGLVGSNNYSSIKYCYVTGSVSGYISVGGVVGENLEGLVSNCYSTSDVEGSYSVGGLVGYNVESRIVDSYAAGNVSGAGNSVGGLVGRTFNGRYYRCFWDSTVNEGLTDCGYDDESASYGIDLYDVEGRTATAMMEEATYFGWDFVNTWAMPAEEGYPVIVGEFSYAEGSGSIDDPYIISTAWELYCIGKLPELWDKCFVVIEDLDLSGYDGLDGRPVYHRIGIKYLDSFSGVFDGGGHTISNLTLDLPDSDCVGLFGHVASDEAVIKNVGLVNVNVTGNNKVGGLAGVAKYCEIEGCYVTGIVTGAAGGQYVGGVVGYSTATIADCYSRVIVDGSYSVGGLVGCNAEGSLSTSYASSRVTGAGVSVGGVVGSDLNGVYGVCIWNKTINPTLSDCGYDRVTGAIQIDLDGVEGKKICEMMLQETYVGFDFLNTWTISEGMDYPVLVWDFSYSWGSGTIDDPYRIGTAEELYYLGFSSGIWDKYFVLVDDIDMSGYDGLGGRPVFHRIGINYSNSFTGVFDGGGHTISNLRLDLPSSDYVGLFGRIESDVTAIKNLGLVDVDISGSSMVGGLVGLNRDCGIENCYVTGIVTGAAGGQYVGGVVGYNSGSVSGSHSAATVEGGDFVGGVAGYNTEGSLALSYSSGKVEGNDFVGGVAGYSSGSVDESYSSGKVEGIFSVGGVVGYNVEGSIAMSYASGSVSGAGDSVGGVVGRNLGGEYTACFWDISINDELADCGYDDDAESYAIDLDGVEGVGTAEMQTASTYTDAGWDFVGESENGNEDIWRLCFDGSSSPRLAWEYYSYGDFVCGDGVDMNDFSYLSQCWGVDGCGVEELSDLAEEWLSGPPIN